MRLCALADVVLLMCVFCCSLQFVLSKLSLGGSEQHQARSPALMSCFVSLTRSLSALHLFKRQFNLEKYIA